MNIGDKIYSEQNSYTVKKNIAVGNRPNAIVFLCENQHGEEVIAKYFYKNKPMPNIGYGKRNHYGRRRDGSYKVFNEIKAAAAANDFLINHFERIKHNGKWVIILEYIRGETLHSFITKHQSDEKLVTAAIISLTSTLSEWHSKGFAHGDPHLDNCLITTTSTGELKTYLIDYSQLHHKDFHYCKQYDCFNSNPNRRLDEDLINPLKNFGSGFRVEIQKIEKTIGYQQKLSTTFDKYYNRISKL